MSMSIGGASLAPQQLAAPQEKPAADAPVEVLKDEPARRSPAPPGTGKVVDKTA